MCVGGGVIVKMGVARPKVSLLGLKVIELDLSVDLCPCYIFSRTEVCTEPEIIKKCKYTLKLTPMNPQVRTYYISVGSERELMVRPCVTLSEEGRSHCVSVSAGLEGGNRH